jgi:hypothetical protein
MSLDEYFSLQTQEHRAICEPVLTAVEALKDVNVEPANIGLMIKRSRWFAELRPRRRWTVLSFAVPRRIDDPRIRSIVGMKARFSLHYVQLSRLEDVDRSVVGWILEAYRATPP